MNCRTILLLTLLAFPVVAQEADNRPSHRPVNPSLADERSPETALANRLMNPRRQKENLDNLEFGSDLQALARRLIKDKEFIDSLRNNISAEDLNRMKEQLQGNDGVDTSTLQKLFDGVQLPKGLSQRETDLLRRWGEDLKKKGFTSPKFPSDPAKPTTPRPPANPDVTGKRPPPTSPNQPTPDRPTRPWISPNQADWMQNRLNGFVKGLDRWIESPTGESWKNTLQDLASRYGKDALNSDLLSKNSAGFVELWKEAFAKTPRPSLPNTNMPTMSHLPGMPTFASPGPMPAPDLASSGTFVLWLLVAGAFLLLVWRFRHVLPGGTGSEQKWRLGPWPVRPEQVQTRGEVVRAFEYLALLRFGLAARTWNHREVVARFGNDPAACELAAVYEKARYLPDDEPLSVTEIEVARKDLCHLAGV
jgi:hypothetical protein